MNEEAETTQTEKIEVSVEPVAEVTPLTNIQSETLVQSLEPAVSTSKESTSTGIKVANTENTDLYTKKETKTMEETVEKKDNKNPTTFEKQNQIHGIAIFLAVLIFLALIVKQLVAKHRVSVATEKVTKKDKDFLKLIYHLNHVYTKTDNYLKQKS